MTNKKGDYPILLSMTVVVLLGMLSMATNQLAIQKNRNETDKLNRTEGFYASEIAAWHGYHTAGVAVTGTPDSKGRYIASFPKGYDEKLPASLKPDPYDPLRYPRGTPLNVKTTLRYDSARTLAWHYTGKNILYRPTPAGKALFCGQNHLGRSNTMTHACLVGTPAPPGYAIPTALSCLYYMTNREKDWYGMFAAQVGAVGSQKRHCSHCNGAASNHIFVRKATVSFAVGGKTYPLGTTISNVDPTQPIIGTLIINYPEPYASNTIATVRTAQEIDIRKYFDGTAKFKTTVALYPKIGVMGCQSAYNVNLITHPALSAWACPGERRVGVRF